MQENGGASRTEEGKSPRVLAFFVTCPGTCNTSAGMSAARWLQECIDATSSLSVSVLHRHDLLALLGVFGKLGYNESLIMASVREEMVNESLVFQRYAKRYAESYAESYAEAALKPAVEAARAQAFEEGERNATIGTILSFLEARFQTTSVHSLRPLLETIDDMERLKQLAPAAASAENLETFLEALSH